PMTTPRASGGRLTQKKSPRKSLRLKNRALSAAKGLLNSFPNLTVRLRKSPTTPEAGQLRAGHTYSRSAACPDAIAETGRYDESGGPAYGRTPLRQPAPAAAAPMRDPCLDSSGSGLQACAAPLQPSRERARPIASTGD